MNRLIAIISTILGLIGSAGLFIVVRNQYEFADSQFFYLLLIVPLIAFIYVWKLDKGHGRVRHSNLNQFESEGLPWKIGFRHILNALRLVGLTAIIIALARPQESRSWEDRIAEGIDIIIALDVSTSMLAQDFSPNRLEASKDVAMKFISGRPDDRIGLVIYEGESFTQVPLTTDHSVLLRMFKEVKTGRLENGTAIGEGLATAVSRLRDSESASKVVILLSDGENTAGTIHPSDAASTAQHFGVRVYTIGVGTKGTARAPVSRDYKGNFQYGRVTVNIDEESLKNIAHETGGQYFRATNKNKLEQVYKEIDRLEKTRINVTEYSKKTEKYLLFAVLGLGLILLYNLFYMLIFRIIE